MNTVQKFEEALKEFNTEYKSISVEISRFASKKQALEKQIESLEKTKQAVFEECEKVRELKKELQDSLQEIRSETAKECIAMKQKAEEYLKQSSLDKREVNSLLGKAKQKQQELEEKEKELNEKIAFYTAKSSQLKSIIG